MKKSYNYKKGGQMMKKVINVFLTIIMACVVVLLVISLSIRTISTKTISNAFFEEEVSNNMKEVLANTFPDVSSENIDALENVIKDNEAINEVANDLLNHISDSISSGNKVDSETILNEISVAIDRNVPVIEEALGKDIPEEQIKEIQSKLTDENSNLKNQIDQTVDKIENMDSSAKQVIKTYDALDVIDFYPVPHYKDESLMEAVEKVIAKYNTKLQLVPFSNSQAILVMGKEKQIVSNTDDGEVAR